MTKKDYIRLAYALAKARPFSIEDDRKINTDPAILGARMHTWRVCRDNIMDVLAADNSRFNRVRFETACDLEEV